MFKRKENMCYCRHTRLIDKTFSKGSESDRCFNRVSGSYKRILLMIQKGSLEDTFLVYNCHILCAGSCKANYIHEDRFISIFND